MPVNPTNCTFNVCTFALLTSDSPINKQTGGRRNQKATPSRLLLLLLQQLLPQQLLCMTRLQLVWQSSAVEYVAQMKAAVFTQRPAQGQECAENLSTRSQPFTTNRSTHDTNPRAKTTDGPGQQDPQHNRHPRAERLFVATSGLIVCPDVPALLSRTCG